MKEFLGIISLVVALVICISADHAIATKFGAKCESNKECDSTSFLTCQSGTCGCQYPEDQIFDHVRNSCVFTLGKVCREHSDLSVPIEIAQRYEMTDFCIPNAKCGAQDKRCVCEDGYFASANGTCEPNRLYHQPCNSHMECESNYGFICSSDGKCGCNSTIGFYDMSLRRCVATFGFPCDNSIQCASNLRCEQTVSTDENGNSTYLRLCVCKSSTFLNPEGACEPKREFGAVCTTNRECNGDNNLVCEDGTCQCKNEHVYEDSRSKCLSLVGTPCQGIISSNCVNNAMCRDVNEKRGSGLIPGQRRTPNRECQCIDNYHMIKNRTCKRNPGYDEPCSLELPCLTKIPSLDLFCDAGRCKCSGNETVYDEKAKQCRRPMGVSCNRTSECISSARCRDKVCTCTHYAATPDSTGTHCLAGYGAKCNATMPCDTEKGQVCLEGRCKCELEDHQYYDMKVKRCLTYTEGPCGDNKVNSCVPNSECSSVTEKEGERECRCKAGFVAVERQCEAGFGQPCNHTGYDPDPDQDASSGVRCDRLAPLTCIQEICQCGKFQYFDETTLKCRGLVGAKCKLTWDERSFLGSAMEYLNVKDDGFCTDGSFCKQFRVTKHTSMKFQGICRCNDGYIRDENRRCVRDTEGDDYKLSF